MNLSDEALYGLGLVAFAIAANLTLLLPENISNAVGRVIEFVLKSAATIFVLFAGFVVVAIVPPYVTVLCVLGLLFYGLWKGNEFAFGAVMLGILGFIVYGVATAAPIVMNPAVFVVLLVVVAVIASGDKAKQARDE